MKIAQPVLEVLAASDCVGCALTLPGALDRKMYTDVNKVLEACGGKWNRKAKTHIFPEDASPLIDAVISSGEVQTSRDTGFFPTPAKLAAELAAICQVRDRFVLEPSAGTGRLIDACLAEGAKVVLACERDPKMRESLRNKKDERLTVLPEDDFLDVEPFAVSRVLMNPPFCKVGRGDHLDHVQHAAKFIQGNLGGILLAVLPVSVIFRQDRRHTAFREWVGSLGGEIDGLPEESFRESGTSVRTCYAKIEFPAWENGRDR